MRVAAACPGTLNICVFYLNDGLAAGTNKVVAWSAKASCAELGGFALALIRLSVSARPAPGITPVSAKSCFALRSGALPGTWRSWGCRWRRSSLPGGCPEATQEGHGGPRSADTEVRATFGQVRRASLDDGECARARLAIGAAGLGVTGFPGTRRRLQRRVV